MSCKCDRLHSITGIIIFKELCLTDILYRQLFQLLLHPLLGCCIVHIITLYYTVVLLTWMQLAHNILAMLLMCTLSYNHHNGL